MGADDLPAFGSANPSLALPSSFARCLALKLSICRGEVAPVGRDGGVAEAAIESEGGTVAAKLSDRIVAIQIFGCAVADRVGTLPEELIQHGNIIAHKSGFVALECLGHFGNDIRKIDFHTGIPIQLGSAPKIVPSPGTGDD